MNLRTAFLLFLILFFSIDAHAVSVGVDETIEPLAVLSDIQVKDISTAKEVSLIVTSKQSCKLGLFITLRAYDKNDVIISEKPLVMLEVDQGQKSKKMHLVRDGKDLHRLEFVKASCT